MNYKPFIDRALKLKEAKDLAKEVYTVGMSNVLREVVQERWPGLEGFTATEDGFKYKDTEGCPSGPTVSAFLQDFAERCAVVASFSYDKRPA